MNTKIAIHYSTHIGCQKCSKVTNASLIECNLRIFLTEKFLRNDAI